jgi:hypothetical protein
VLVAWCWAGPLDADTLVLDQHDVADWVRVLDRSSWKYCDAALTPNALLKFDLAGLGPVAQILDARLHLFVERGGSPGEVAVRHVQEDGWSYAYSRPETLLAWPTWHDIAVLTVADSGSHVVDVTQHLREELQAADRYLSVKLTGTGPGYGPLVRFASPLAPVWRMRPRLVVQYEPAAGNPARPDLALCDADIRFSPMRPVPGQTVSLRASVHNLGPAAASNVQVAFWDGAPPDGSPIGTAILPDIPGGGGEALAEVSWTSSRGTHEIVVVVDPADLVPERGEGNNSDLRVFRVTDPAGYETAVESFEDPGLGGWSTDWEVPYVPFADVRTHYVNRTGVRAYHGRHALELYLNGVSDDGTVWVETESPVEPYSTVDAQVEFEFFRYHPDLAFMPVVAVTPWDPESEADFDLAGPGNQEGWLLYTYQRSVQTGPYDVLHLAVGITVSWEMPGMFFLDLVRTRVTPVPGGVNPPAPPWGSSDLLQSRPNPMGPLATIAYRLGQDGPVTLRVYDTTGRLLATLRDGEEKAGWHEAKWDGRDDRGQPLPSGVYYYRLATRAGEASRKLLLAR